MLVNEVSATGMIISYLSYSETNVDGINGSLPSASPRWYQTIDCILSQCVKPT